MTSIIDLEQWVAQYSLPFFRISAMLMAAPMFGARLIPQRIRVIMALVLGGLLAPLVPGPSMNELSGATLFVTIFHELVIGLTLGFMVQMVFDAIIIGSQTIAMSMGLGFAMMVDPARGINVPVLSQFFLIITTLMFLALDGHLMLLHLLLRSFEAVPPGVSGLSIAGYWGVAAWGAEMFAGAVRIALPAVVALLIINLGYGVISRAAPTMNLFAVGLPVTMLLGFVILEYSFSVTLTDLTQMLEATMAELGRLLVVP